MKTGLWIALAALPLCACTPDYPRLPPLPAQAAPFTTGDAAFLQQANEHDLTQVALGKLAADHARAAEVKDLALSSVKDYEAHRATLATLAGKHDLALTDAPLARDQATIERLSKLHGPRFDTAYVTALRDEAQANEKATVSASATLKDGDLKSAATALQKLDQSRISSAYSWLPHLSTRKHSRGQKR
ncbi:DUF4142 domain-containing protein [Asaia astilbis]|uniref:DUF4142 domain-containing protein n=1 Tax=Asaia astilbis TaxID=610244 RepID=UPI000AD41341|nr:DUF4142 domain-containing protein [Asaia astilbis]